MNRRQRVVIWIGLTIFTIVGLFPPVTWGAPFSGLNHSFFARLVRGQFAGARLLMLWTMVVVVTGTLFWLFRSPWDRETRCRKRGYILRGISEPRCPECGESI